MHAAKIIHGKPGKIVNTGNKVALAIVRCTRLCAAINFKENLRH